MMEAPYKPKRTDPELRLRTDLIHLMEKRGWWVHIMHGNAYSSGLPDLYAAHRNFGTRWIEVKNGTKFHFTDAQEREFPKMFEKGVGIWIVALHVGYTESRLIHEYENVVQKGAPNLMKYWKETRRPY